MIDPRDVLTALAPSNRLHARRSMVGPAALTAAGVGATSPALPDHVVERLAAWRLLHDVPFGYLVPDPAALPMESIRFFRIDAAWVEALVSGALAVGAVAERELARATDAEPQARRAADRKLRSVRDRARGRTAAAEVDAERIGGADEVCGFLLRSLLVSQFPGLSVRAYRTTAVPLGADPAVYDQEHPEDVVPLLRIERLAPTVMIVLLQGSPKLVWLQEPHHGVQQGVDPAPGGGLQVPVRDVTGAVTAEPPVPLPLRGNAPPGVVDVATLVERLDAAHPLGGPGRGGAGLGLALLQPPARQRFEEGP
ncbi:hypothetical protein [Geodermatophilus amargosae]|nr:hypothetical protein [Geodermatophilus amargosae]